MESKKSLRLAIIGCGKIVEVSHLPAVLQSRRATIAALIDTHVENAHFLKKKYSLDCPTAHDISSIKEKIDGAIIATPNDTHASIATVCLENKIPVLIEKPLCIQSSEAAALETCAKKNGTFISVGYIYRYLPSVPLMKELLAANYFGKVKRYELAFGTRGGWSPVSGYSLRRDQCGGGVLMISGTHFIDRLLYWFGMPDTLEYEDDSRGGVEANCKATFHYHDADFRGSIFLSKTVPMKEKFFLDAEKCSCEVAGDKIIVYPKNEKNLQYEVSSRSGTKKELKGYFEVQLDNFIDSVQGIAEPTVDAAFAGKSVFLMERMYREKKQLDEPWMRRI